MNHLKEFLTELSSLPHRGSTTGEEKAAAEIIRKRLKESGYSVRLDRFQSPATYSWELIIIAVCVGLGLIISPKEPHLGGILCTFGLWQFVRYFDGHTTLIGKLITRKPSQNVVAELDSAPKDRTVYLMAHYDTTRASHLFHPSHVKNFRVSFLASSAVTFIAPVIAFAGEWFSDASLYWFITLTTGIYVLIQVLFLLHREFFHTYVNGANDNGSGVAVILALAKYFAENPLSNISLKIIATGCEETGLYGARDFVSRYGNRDEQFYVLNFDNVGAGNLHYCTGEGMLGFHHYDASLVNLNEHIAAHSFPGIKPHRYTRAYFDTLPLVHNDIKCITYISLDENELIPNWHWYSDTIDNINWVTMKQTIDFGIAVIREIDRITENSSKE